MYSKFEVEYLKKGLFIETLETEIVIARSMDDMLTNFPNALSIKEVEKIDSRYLLSDCVTRLVSVRVMGKDNIDYGYMFAYSMRDVIDHIEARYGIENITSIQRRDEYRFIP